MIAGHPFRILLDLLFPVICVGCGTGDTWMCSACITHAKKEHDASCPFCPRNTGGKTCSRCAQRQHVRGIISCGQYRTPVMRTAIHALKFHGVRALAHPLGDMLAGELHTRFSATDRSRAVLVPIPLYPRRERSRGFNQSALLADAVSERLHIRVEHLLKRTRPTFPQTHVPNHARGENVARAFDLQNGNPRDALSGRIILIDDVSTTTSTLESAAKALYTHGARDIWGAVVARG